MIHQQNVKQYFVRLYYMSSNIVGDIFFHCFQGRSNKWQLNPKVNVIDLHAGP